MIKSALEYLVNLAPVEKLVIGDRQYTDRPIVPVKTPLADTLQLNTLTGIKDYLKSDSFDGIDIEDVILHVSNYRTVGILLPLTGEFRQREVLVQAVAPNWEFQFGKYLERERFQIGLMASFEQSEMRDRVLRAVSGIVQSSEVKTADDGISQRVTARVGVARVGEMDLPNPVTLKPFRTFTEAQQPESDFVFRIKNCENGTQNPDIGVGLFEADGGAWKLQAALNIKAWLVENIPYVRVVV